MKSNPTQGTDDDSGLDSEASGSARVLRQLADYLETVDPETVRVRREAEEAARELIEERLGRLEEEHLRKLYQFFNQD